ncbi:methyltransferase domain-containing protein [Flagellimonas sp. 389]|uniref:methyltransferase domain-containing protein n=1 Tax=Flagellimonas sp. 389 TaxID=2835862 RepID=UPI001BD39DA1|nr:methyltransferase domain-containing protein [Flagellimonas sp. 389]MBS9463450.1 methyltransferase domain-containing protein [Flagellimonas sp. 389]
MDFSVRSKEPELMDDSNMKFDTLSEAYADINRCNSLLGGDGITLNAVWDLVKMDVKKSYTILDMGCGDGTMLRKLSDFLSKREVSHSMIGIDLRDDVLRIAKEKSIDFPNLTFKKVDILKADSELTCDILINTLTMHHFDEDRIDAFLKQFVHLAKIGVVINDLQRSRMAYVLFHVFGLFFIRTKVAKYDGLVSISKGFRKEELIALSKNIPNVIHKIQWKWAFRYVWIMNFKRQYS